MAVLDFFRRGKRSVVALHYNHGTEHAKKAEECVTNYCKEHEVPLCVGYNSEPKPKGKSWEEFWRDKRYEFFSTYYLSGESYGWTEQPFVVKESFYNGSKIITCHHLDDVVETWIFTALNGNPFLIPIKRGQFIRPFLTTRRSEFTDWCDRKDVPFVNDPSNEDTKYMRNFIRKELIPSAMVVNEGIHKTIKKKVEAAYESREILF